MIEKRPCGRQAGKPLGKTRIEMEDTWGIKVLSVRQSAKGYMLDFRYRIIDAEKAAPLFSPRTKPHIIDQASGAVMAVPDVPKLGPMRSTIKAVKDKNYAILFANPGQYIKPGNKVTVVVGDSGQKISWLSKDRFPEPLSVITVKESIWQENRILFLAWEVWA